MKKNNEMNAHASYTHSEMCPETVIVAKSNKICKYCVYCRHFGAEPNLKIQLTYI